VKSKVPVTDLFNPSGEEVRVGRKRTRKRIEGTVIGWRGGTSAYRLKAKISLPTRDSLLSAIVVASFSDKESVPSSRISLDIEENDPEELVASLQSAMMELGNRKPITRTILTRALNNLYSDACACVRLFAAGAEWPVLADLEADKTLVARLEKYDIHNGESIKYELYVPPVAPEEYYHLQTRIEISFLPYSLDLMCRISSRGKEDSLYNRLLATLPDGTCEKGDVLSFPYGALLDCGQVFTYAECYELGTRISIV
jgi:hypothetical protein